MKYSLKKNNGYVIYEAESKKIVHHYKPKEFDQVIMFFKIKRCPPETFCAVSNAERKSIEDACNF